MLVSVQTKEALSGSSYSDYLVFGRAVLEWRRLQQEGGREERDEYLDTHTLSRASLRFINGKFDLLTDSYKRFYSFIKRSCFSILV